MAALAPGAIAYVCYVGDDLWHERVVVGNAEYVVCSPDFDIFIEQLDAGNADLSGIRYSDETGGLPVGMTGAQAYSFTVRVGGLQLVGLLREGEAHARTERLGRGLAGAAGAAPFAAGALAPLVVPVVLPAVAAILAPQLGAGGFAAGFLAAQPAAAAAARVPRFAGPGGTWLLDEPVDGYEIGQEVLLPPGALSFGTRSIVQVGVTAVSISRVAAGVDLGAWAALRRNHLVKQDGRLIPLVGALGALSLSDAVRLMGPAPATVAGLRGPDTMADTMR